MNEILDNISKLEQCNICGDIADGYHYGVLSCRGCNAFFRRAITHRMKFFCRRNGNCIIDKNARCACRACRLRKCEEMGMDRKAVQLKKNIPSKESTDRQTSSNSCSDSATEFSPSGIVISSPESVALAPMNDGIMKMECTQVSPSTSRSSFRLIVRLAEDYKEQKIRRHMMLCSCVEEILRDEARKLRRPATSVDYSSIFKVQIVLMFEWVQKLDDFRSIIDATDKARLLRAFALQYFLLDNIFHSVEMGCRDKIVLVNNSFIVPGHVPAFFPAEINDSQYVRFMMYGNNSFRLINDIIVPLIEMNFSEEEMMALRLIIFWNPKDAALSPQTKDIMQSAKDRTVLELHRWYADQNMPNIDTRLGNILLFISLISDEVQNLNEMVRMIPSFGILSEWDSLITDILAL